MPDGGPKPQFEPPPWEVEAFERFRQEQERLRSLEELEQALGAARATAEQGPSPTTPSEFAQLAAGPPQIERPAPESAPTDAASPASIPVIPEARIEAMLAELRSQETPAAGAGLTLVYSAVAFMGTTGVFMVIAALVLFTKTKSAGGPGTIVAALASMVMLLTGAGCVAGATMLYRKHHQ